jgi:hypothetical protein
LFANFSTGQTRIAIFLAVWLLSVSYPAANLSHGWLSYDDGALGQSAGRVLRGEIPHIDFADPYTGGLAFLDALVFKIFGVQLIQLPSFPEDWFLHGLLAPMRSFGCSSNSRSRADLADR